jgi:PST family polysaccharide transporter
MSLKHEIIFASKWAALSEFLAKGITALVFLVLAHLLTPQDFGIVAVAAMIITFVQVFWDAGLSKALIQRQTDIDEAANIVFWTNIFLSAIVYAVVYFLAAPIAQHIQEPQVHYVIQVQGLLIPLGALASVPTAFYQRNLDFKFLFYIKFFTVVLPGFTSILLALMGFTYWALVGGVLLGHLIQVIVLWWTQKDWRPRFIYNRKLAWELMEFGFWVTGESVLGWLFIWADALIIGIYLGTQDLGLYRTGSAFVAMLFSLLLSPLLPVLYRAYAIIHQNSSQFIDSLLQANKLTAMIALPVGCGLFVLQYPLAECIFGSSWEGIGPIIGWLGISNGLAWLVVSNSEAYRAIGRPDLNTKIMSAAILLFLPSFVIAAAYGLKTFLMVRFLLTFAGIFIHMHFAQRYLNLTWSLMISRSKWIFFASIFSCGVVFLVQDLNPYSGAVIVKLFLYAAMGLFLYFLMLFGEWPFLRRIASYLLSHRGGA